MAHDIASILGCQNPVSCLSHLLAAPIFAVLGYSLVERGWGNPYRVAGLLVLALTSVFLLSMSGVYHLLGPGVGRDVFRQLDFSGW